MSSAVGCYVPDGLLDGSSAFDIVFQAGEGVALNIPPTSMGWPSVFPPI